MSGSVHTRVEGEVGLILVDNPPVNALSHDVRLGITEAVGTLAGDERIGALLLLCEGRTFIAGADIKEFGKPRQPPSLSELCDAIEACPKPIVAAIHGTALGGGFEIALACHYRIASAEASMGLPEVKLGLIPGAGGANRLARIVGAAQALEMTVGGEKLSAGDAHEMGLVEALSEGDLKADALIFTKHLLEQRCPPRPTRNRPPPALDQAALDEEAAKLLARRRGEEAPAACVDSVRRALTLPFDEAIAADRAAFAALSAGTQSRALRHAFFAERRAAKLDAVVTPRPVSRVAIVGAGTMGGGIAMSFAAAGIEAALIDRDAAAVERGMERIRGNYRNSVARGSIAAEEADRRLALIGPAIGLDAASTADLVVEAVFEDMTLKKAIFSELEAICGEEAVLATNTSALDVDEIAASLRRPERFVGLHFFSPANVMKLVEIVRAAATSNQTLATAVAVAKRIGKVAVVAGNCDGFIGNRMVAKRGAQVDNLLLRGALPEEVDAALKAFGFPMGPLAINDMSGLDVGYSIRKRRGTSFPVADAVVESGRLGQKTGKGYYRYDEGSRTPQPDPEVEELIRDMSKQLGVERQTRSREEMIERMIFPLINEGARIVEEGIARRASDVDVVWINGYGFPRWRGGPMFYADEVGLGRVAERLAAFAADGDDPSLQPASLLTELAASGRSFQDWDRQRAAASV